jgi:hypothetical protein
MIIIYILTKDNTIIRLSFGRSKVKCEYVEIRECNKVRKHSKRT